MENDALWFSLPVPAILIDADDCIAQVNTAAELFLNASAKSLTAMPVFDRLHIDAALDNAFARVRRDQGALFINTVDVGGSGQSAPVECNIQIAPPLAGTDQVLMLLQPRQIADRLGRAQGGVKSAAASAIGMAEMLAHEIKNPLAGITGAAQLLSMGGLSPPRIRN